MTHKGNLQLHYQLTYSWTYTKYKEPTTENKVIKTIIEKNMRNFKVTCLTTCLLLY